MPDSRRHRGPNPRDPELFSAARVVALREAVAHLSWMLSRGYAVSSALKLVGDRFKLTQRQREAVARAACSDEAAARREEKEGLAAKGDEVWVDGFNVLLTVEMAFGGGVVLRCRDGCYRDIASVHGTYRRVQETARAIEATGSYLAKQNPKVVVLLLDAPVSNSGKLGQLVLADWSKRFDCRLELVPNPDAVLKTSGSLVASADSQILDVCGRWLNLARNVVLEQVPSAWIVNLSDDS